MLKLLLIAFPCIIFLTAFTTPFVYTTIVSVFGQINYPFSRIFDRVAMIWIVVGLLIFKKKLFSNEYRGLKESFKNIISHPKIIFGASVLTLFSSFLITLILFYQNIFELREHGSVVTILGKTVKLIVTAYFIAILEELFFRYLIVSEYVKNNLAVRGIFISSILYAICHFITPIYEFKYTTFDPTAGFNYIFEISKRFLIIEVYQGVIGLFLVGIVLGTAFYRTKRLTLGIGLHAGWIASLKLIFLFVALPQSYQTNLPLSRRYILVAHPYTWVSIVIIFFLVIWWTKNSKNQQKAML